MIHLRINVIEITRRDGVDRVRPLCGRHTRHQEQQNHRNLFHAPPLKKVLTGLKDQQTEILPDAIHVLPA
jgi:hypothetical protein